jgi:hypothetical protein
MYGSAAVIIALPAVEKRSLRIQRLLQHSGRFQTTFSGEYL